MKKIQAYAAGRELVLWCAGCQAIVGRLGGMHTVAYINVLANDHECITERVSNALRG